MGDSKIEVKKLSADIGDFSKLPPEVVEEVPFYLSDQDMAFFSATNRSFLKTFENQLQKRQLNCLVHYVLNGDWMGADQILKGWEKRLSRISKTSGLQEEAKSLKDRHLLKIKLKMKDRSGRVFDNITLFEYAIWAKDVKMILTFLKFLSREDAICQFEKMDANITYHYLWKEEKESSYNPRSLIEAHDALLGLAADAVAADAMVEAKIVKDTLRRVYQGQRTLPVCFIWDLCDPRNQDLSAPVGRRWRLNRFHLNHCTVISERKTLSKWFNSNFENPCFNSTDNGLDFKPQWDELETGFISPESLARLASLITANGNAVFIINMARYQQLQAIQVCLGIRPARRIDPFHLRFAMDELLVREDFVSVFGPIEPQNLLSLFLQEKFESVFGPIEDLSVSRCSIS